MKEPSKDTGDELRLNSKDFPKQINLELSDEVVDSIQKISLKTGRSFSEVVTDILSRAVDLE